MQVEKIYKCRNCGNRKSYVKEHDSVAAVFNSSTTVFLHDCECILESTNNVKSFTVGDLIKINVGE